MAGLRSQSARWLSWAQAGQSSAGAVNAARASARTDKGRRRVGRKGMACLRGRAPGTMRPVHRRPSVECTTAYAQRACPACRGARQTAHADEKAETKTQKARRLTTSDLLVPINETSMMTWCGWQDSNPRPLGS